MTTSISSRAGTTESVDITLVIARNDCDTGVAYSCGECPIAISFKRTCPGAAKVEVGARYLTFWTWGGDRYDILLPIDAQDFVANFDNGGEVSPFHFDLPLPTHLVNTPGFLCSDESEWAPVANWESPL